MIFFTMVNCSSTATTTPPPRLAPCRVELSDDEGDDDLEGENENYICTLLDEDGRECGQRWPKARALAALQRHTQEGTRGEPEGVASLVVTNQCFWCGSTHASIETTSKHMAAAEKHNRCVVDACRFHHPVIDIPPDTICPRCDLIFFDAAELQRHLASVQYPHPEGHSLVINAETPDSACGSALWQKIRDRWRAGRAERETKTQQTATWRDEGRRDDGEPGAEGNLQGRQLKHGREATQRRPQDALRPVSASTGSQRRRLHVLDDQARGARVQENKGAKVRLLGTGGDQGQGPGLGPPGIAAFTGLLQALSVRGSTVGAASAAGVANLKQTWEDSEPEGAFDLVTHCELGKVYDLALSRLELVISFAQHREHIRGALGQTGANRLLGQAPSGTLERALSAAIEQKLEK